MGLAQHHGIPTRLIDWTINPIIAAFFSASPPFISKTAEKICVWGLDQSKLSELDGSPKAFGDFKIELHAPRRGNNAYLHAQHGVFTELYGTDQFYVTNRRWPSLEDVFSSHNSDEPILVGHTLLVAQVPRLLALLSRDGITLSQLMPTLDNVGKEVISNWGK